MSVKRKRRGPRRSYESSWSNKSRIGSRFNFNKNLYSLKTTPQRYGPGVKFQNLELFQSVTNGTEIELNTIFTSSPEHNLYKTMYNYFKLLNVAVIFPMQEASVASHYLVFQMNWNNGDTYGIQFEENNKWVPLYRTKDICYKFVPPDIPLILGTTQSPVVINLNNYMRTTDNIVIPGSLFFKCDSSNSDTMCRVVVKVEYRGSKLPDSTSLNNYLLKFGNTNSQVIEENKSNNKILESIKEIEPENTIHTEFENQHKDGQRYFGPKNASTDVFLLRFDGQQNHGQKDTGGRSMPKAGPDVFGLSRNVFDKYDRKMEVAAQQPSA
jgi:hypothetical protein